MARSSTETCVFAGKPGVEPSCTKRRKPGLLVCGKHEKMFAKWREETPSGSKLFTGGGKRKRPGKKTPTCCRPGCFNERVPPDPFCGPACESMMDGNE